MELSKSKIAIIGLGYVGLPLAVEFGKKYETVGFDIDENRIKQLLKGKDDTLFALMDGYVKFQRKGRSKKQVSILEKK